MDPATAKLVKETREGTALVISAGAPQAPLVAGALYGLYEKGIRFRQIYASGGGALIALLLVSPKKNGNGNPTLKDRLKGLKSITELGVHDRIHDVLPLGYKTFFTSGPFTQPFRQLAKGLKLGPDFPARNEAERDAARFYDDWIDLVTAIVTPSSLTPWNILAPRGGKVQQRSPEVLSGLGLCEPFPLAEELVGFDLLRRWRGEIHMPGYNLEESKVNARIRQFSNRPQQGEIRITPDALRACLAAPFIYPPVRLPEGLFIEGAFESPYNVHSGWLSALTGDLELTEDKKKIRNILILDMLGTEEMERQLLRKPIDLWDAYGASIMTPVVAQAKTTRKLLGKLIATHPEVHWMPRFRFEAGKDRYVRLMQRGPEKYIEGDGGRPTYLADWSRSALEELFEIGKDSAYAYLRVPLTETVDDERLRRLRRIRGAGAAARPRGRALQKAPASYVRAAIKQRRLKGRHKVLLPDTREYPDKSEYVRPRRANRRRRAK